MDNKEMPENTNNSKKTSSWMADYRDVSGLLPPVLSFGVFVYILDKIFDSRPFIVMSGVFIAFILVNIAIYRKMKVLINKYSESEKDKENKEK